MRIERPVILDDRLRIATPYGRPVQLTPREGFNLAEELIRHSTRRAIEESLDVAPRPRGHQTSEGTAKMKNIHLIADALQRQTEFARAFDAWKEKQRQALSRCCPNVFHCRKSSNLICEMKKSSERFLGGAIDADRRRPDADSG